MLITIQKCVFKRSVKGMTYTLEKKNRYFKNFNSMFKKSKYTEQSFT